MKRGGWGEVTITKTRSEQQEDKTLKSQRLRQKGLKAQHTANTRGVPPEGGQSGATKECRGDDRRGAREGGGRGTL